MIRRAHEARLDRVVVETRLDADDAINVEYIATLQSTALTMLEAGNVSKFTGINRGNDSTSSREDNGRARWLYWCPQNHIQWNPSDGADAGDDPGLLQAFNIPNMCVTTGLSLGFGVGTTEDDVPRYQHSKVYKHTQAHPL